MCDRQILGDRAQNRSHSMTTDKIALSDQVRQIRSSVAAQKNTRDTAEARSRHDSGLFERPQSGHRAATEDLCGCPDKPAGRRLEQDTFATVGLVERPQSGTEELYDFSMTEIALSSRQKSPTPFWLPNQTRQGRSRSGLLSDRGFWVTKERPQTFVTAPIHAGEPSKVTFAIVVGVAA